MSLWPWEVLDWVDRMLCSPLPLLCLLLLPSFVLWHAHMRGPSQTPGVTQPRERLYSHAHTRTHASTPTPTNTHPPTHRCLWGCIQPCGGHCPARGRRRGQRHLGLCSRALAGRCVRVCVYTRVHRCVSACARACVYGGACARACLGACLGSFSSVCVCACVCVCVCVRARLRSCVCACTLAFIGVSLNVSHAHIQTYPPKHKAHLLPPHPQECSLRPCSMSATPETLCGEKQGDAGMHRLPASTERSS